MRLTILSFYSGHVDRGVEVYAKELKQRLNIQVDVIAPESYTKQIRSFTKRVLSKLEADPPDTLYPLNNRWQSILSKLFCLRHKTKLVLGGHSGLGWDDKLNLWLFPDVFICFTKAQESWAKKINPFAKTVVIPHGVDVNKFSPTGPTAKLSLPRPIFLTTKKPVQEPKQGSLLVLSGKHVVPHDKIDEYYRAADVFVMTSSRGEAFGISYLEAMACNLPIVATDDPIRREIIGPAGVFIKNPHDVSEYNQKLQQALTTKWDNIPREQAIKYSWDKIMPLYEKLFNSL